MPTKNSVIGTSSSLASKESFSLLLILVLMLKSSTAFIARTALSQGICRVASASSSSVPSIPSRGVHCFSRTINKKQLPIFFRSSSSIHHQVRMMAGAGGAVDPRSKARAAHILVKTEQEADEVIKRLEAGEDFGEVAMVESSCPSKQGGGDLGWFGPNQMVPEFDAVCFSNDNAPGAQVKVETQFGWHIVKILGKTTAPGDMHPTKLGEILGDASKKAEYQLIDVREPDEIKISEIKGAGFVNLPLTKFNEWGPKVMEGQLLEKGKQVIVLCHHGGRSMQVANFLSSQAGFSDVFNLSGGIHMYSSLVDSSIPQY